MDQEYLSSMKKKALDDVSDYKYIRAIANRAKLDQNDLDILIGISCVDHIFKIIDYVSREEDATMQLYLSEWFVFCCRNCLSTPLV